MTESARHPQGDPPVRLTGRIEDLGVAEILYMVGIARRSGLLVLDARDGDHRVLFREGDVVAVQSRRSPQSLVDLLVKRNLVDPTHLAVLERQARQQGRVLTEVLTDEGILRAGVLEASLRETVTAALERLLELREGTFSFELVEDRLALVREFGELVLSTGIPPNRLPGVSGAEGRDLAGGLSALPRGSGARQVDLLVPETDISLPAVPVVRPGQRQRQVLVEAEEASAHPRALVSVAWTAFGAELRQHLEAAGFVVDKARSQAEAVSRIETALERAAPMAVVADAAHPTVPGVELIARAKILDRGLPVVLLLDSRSTASQRTALRERAHRLGVTHVTLLPGISDESALGTIAAEVGELVTASLDREDAGESSAVTRLAGEALVLPLADDAEPPGERESLGRAARSHQQVALAERQRTLLPTRWLPDLGLELLDVAREYAPRSALFVRREGVIRAFGGFGAAGAQGDFVTALRALALSPLGDDLIATVFREGRTFNGPPPATKEDARLLECLGGVRPREVAVFPMLRGGRTLAALYADDLGQRASLPDLSELERFVTGASGAFAAAVDVSRRRSEARNRRSAP